MTAPSLGPGANIAGKYTVRAMLGHSGASATYQAASAQGYEVAVKLFSPTIAQRPDVMQMIERLYAETNALSAELAMPIIDAGYDANTGAPFGVTQMATIPSLQQLVAQRPLTGNEVAAMLKSMSRALDNAHIREVMHHALKPSNVFVDTSAGNATRLTDFGANIPRSIVPTHEGYAMSAPWMAPEQVTGSAPAGAAADVFSAALVAFFALTGTSYWRSCQGPSPNIQAWQQEIMAPRTPPSARAGEVGLRLNPALDVILMRALAHEPHERFRTVGEFATAFDSALGSARDPEMASTMAFPAVSESAGAGGYGAAPGGMSPMGGGMGGMSGMGGPSPDAGYPPPPAPYGGAAAYTATLPSTGMPAPELAAAQPQRPSSGKLAPILVGVVALLLVGGGIAAWLFLGGTPPSDTPTASSASATPPTSAVAAGTTSAAPTAPPPEPSTSAAPPKAAEVEVKVKCLPGCDEIRVDDQKVEDPTKPLMLAPGTYKVTAIKAGYKELTETITVEEGKALSKDLKLVSSAPVAVSNPKPPTTTTQPVKKCTKLIKTNCKN